MLFNIHILLLIKIKIIIIKTKYFFAVALGEHLRLLEPPLVQSRLSLYEYIGEIAPLPDITPFLFGYTDDGASWNPDKALSYSTH